MHFSLPSMRRSRHPLARALSLLLGMALVGLLLVFGLVVAGVLMVGGVVLLAWRYWTNGRKLTPPGAATRERQPEVLEGEFVVLHHRRPVTH
ncbi:hypothetical protein [Rhodanobacter ginsenosidimutans]|uniref:Uncharacterized protein n=1 Tax=Rhodanobacter ginsenosidimutans TaxID=490571 RepID=A0ABW0JXY3_9GAMM